VVIVTFNNRHLNELCLSSVLSSAYPNLEVIVVDNCSTDGTKEFLDGLDDSRLKILRNNDNLGFSAANNQGMRLASGSFIVLLNNDTVCPPFLFNILIGHLQSNPDLGLVGPVTNAIGNEARIPVEYEDLRDLDAWADHVYQMESGNLVEIDMLAFFCVAFSRETLENIGFLDERFGIGMFEDDDYNKRVRTAGLQVKLAKDAFVHHWHHASFKLLGEEQFLTLLGENGTRFREKWQSEND
jgi:GT2 family glycosyltransferase